MMEIKTNTNNVNYLEKNNLPTTRKADAANKKVANAPVEVSEDFGEFQKRVLELSNDPSKIEDARKALYDGTLESETALLSAAENILNFGL